MYLENRNVYDLRSASFYEERACNGVKRWFRLSETRTIIWLASRNNVLSLLSQAGPSITIQGVGEWVAAYPEEERQQWLKEDPDLLERWHDVYGDRMTELVMIGVGINQAQIEQSLDACLLTEEELKKDWSSFKDPLPPFAEA